MGTSKTEISRMFDYGVKEKATHMIIVCDTYDHEDYPVYVMPHENARQKFDEYNGKNMQRVMEVYCLKMDKEQQLNAHRVFNFDMPAESAPKKKAAVKKKSAKTTKKVTKVKSIKRKK